MVWAAKNGRISKEWCVLTKMVSNNEQRMVWATKNGLISIPFIYCWCGLHFLSIKFHQIASKPSSLNAAQIGGFGADPFSSSLLESRALALIENGSGKFLAPSGFDVQPCFWSKLSRNNVSFLLNLKEIWNLRIDPEHELRQSATIEYWLPQPRLVSSPADIRAARDVLGSPKNKTKSVFS